MADEIITTGIKIDTTGVDKGVASLEALATTGDKVDKSLGKVENTAAKAGKSIGNLGGQSAAGINSVGAAADKAADSMEDLARASKDAGDSTKQLGDSFGLLKQVAIGFVGTLSAATVIQLGRAFLQTADAVTNIRTQLQLAEGSASEAARSYDALLTIAQRSRVSFTELAGTYAQVRRATSDLGLSSKDTLRVTETLAKAITLSGASAGAAQAALVQLSQGLASGTLRGDELNSILEQTPRIARALADGLGVTVGQLRELGAAGQLTGESVAQALLKASSVIDREFGQSVTTAGQATTVLGNSITALVGELDKASGTSATVARSLVSIAGAIDGITAALKRLEGSPLKSIVLPEAGTLATAIPLPLRAIQSIAERLIPTGGTVGIGGEDSAQVFADYAKATEGAAKVTQAAADKFLNAADNLTKAQKKLAAQNVALREFAQAAKGYANDTETYKKLYAALQVRLENIDTQYAAKTASTRTSAGADREAEQAARELERAYLAVSGVTADYLPMLERYQSLRASGRISEEQYVDAVERLARAQPGVRAGMEAMAAAQKVLSDAVEKGRKEYDAIISSLTRTVEQERERVAQIGLTREAIEARTLAQMDATIATQEAALADEQLWNAQSPLIAAYEEEIRLLKERRALFATGAERQAEVTRREESVRAARESASEWQKSADEINRALTDSLFRAAEAGKGFFETLRDSIVGMFNNMVLRPIVSATIGTLTSGLGLTGAANAASSAGGLGSLSTLAGLGGSLGAFGSGFSSGLTAWGAGGSVTGLLGSGSSLFAGGIANGLGTIAGALGPIALGVAAIAAIVSALDDGGGPKTGGSFSTTGERLFTPADADALATSIGQSVVASTAALLSRYGGSLAGSTVSIGFDRDPLGESGTRIASRVISAGGRTTLDNSVGRQVADADLSQELQVEAQRVLLAALQASNLEDGFSDVFARLDPATAAPDAIANLLTLADTLYQLGEASRQLPGVMGSVAELSATAREQLIGLAGGLDALVSKQATYYAEFFTDAERFAQSQKNLTTALAGLGIAFDQADTREEFRAIVEGIDLTTESGRGLYASLLTLAGPLAQWIDAADALAQASADAAAATAKQIEADRKAQQQAAIDGSRAAAAQMLQREIDDLSASATDMERAFGDLAGAMDEINATAGNLVDTWRETRGAIEQIQRALGTFVDMSTSGQIAAVVDARASNIASRDSIVAFRDSLTDQIFEAMLSGLSLTDQAAQLRAAEREAFTSIGTATDPVAAAQRAMDLSLRRIALEARIEEDGRRENLNLAEQARELQADTLRDQIDGFRTLAEYANRLRETSFSLKVGNLSALNPETQLSLAKNEFDRLAERARSGDADALSSIGGVAQTLLEEARGIYGSGRPYASIFSGVTGTLDELGASGSSAAQQAEALSRQLAAVEATQAAAEFTADTSAETVAVLTAIDAALTTRQDALDTSIAAQTAALTGLLTTLTTVEGNQRAQITQAAATWTQLQARMDALVAQQAAQARSTQAQEAIV